MKKSLVILSLLTGLALASSAAPAKPTDGSWRTYSQNFNEPVEQWTQGGALQRDFSLWVVNPSFHGFNYEWCLWDSDDHMEMSFSGVFEPGHTASITKCFYADTGEDIHYARSATEDIEVTVTVRSGPHTQTVTGEHVACILGPDYDLDGDDMQPIEGSNADPALWGKAVLSYVTFTATNTGRKKQHSYGYAYYGFYVNQGPGGGDCLLGQRFGYDPAWRLGAS